MSTTAIVGNRTVEVRNGRAQCPGCGEWFQGERGLRSHMGGRFVSMDCRPFRAAQ